MTDQTPDVLIVGGGIGGLSAAVALSRKGIRVRALREGRGVRRGRSRPADRPELHPDT